jgi:hypothetical protein
MWAVSFVIAAIGAAFMYSLHLLESKDKSNKLKA